MKVPGSESSKERKFQGAKVPGSESSKERKLQGAKVPHLELSIPGANGLGSEKSSYPAQSVSFGYAQTMQINSRPTEIIIYF